MARKCFIVLLAIAAVSVLWAQSPPTLTAVSPNVVATGTSVPVTLNGTNFVNPATVLVSPSTGVTVGPIVVVNSTTITTTFTIATSAAATARNVTVTTTGGTSGAKTLTVVAHGTDTVTNSPFIGSTYQDVLNVSAFNEEIGTPPDPPSCGDGHAYRSVWYRFTSPVVGTLVVDTFGSDYDTIVSAFDEAPNGNLRELPTGDPNHQPDPIDPPPYGCNDDWVDLQSQIFYETTANTTYYLLVTSYGTTAGTLNLHVKFYTGAPPNDNFSSPNTVVSRLPFSDTTADFYATREGTDPIQPIQNPPSPPCGSGELPWRTLWYKYTPGGNVTITADTLNTDYYAIVSVYTGGPPGPFTQVTCNASGTLSFAATGGTTYSFMVAAEAGNISPFDGVTGVLRFHIDTIPSSKRRSGQITSQ